MCNNYSDNVVLAKYFTDLIVLTVFRPDLFDYQKILGRPPNINLAHAFEKARTSLGVPSLLDPEGKFYSQNIFFFLVLCEKKSS